MNKSRSKSIYQQALKYLPAGVNSPVRSFSSVGGTPLYIKKGQGPYIFDEDNNQYIDYCLSWGPLILGHANPDLVKTLQKTTALGTSFGTVHKNEVELAELVIKSFPSIEKIRFVNSGTEATMSAIRLARGYTNRKKIIKFEGCYHGHADFLLVAAGSGLATLGKPDSAGVTPDNAKDTIVLPYNNLDSLKKCLKRQAKDIAALIVEPVPCNYGLVLPKNGYLKQLRKLCDRYKIVLIFDEVITGFRLSLGGAQEYYQVKADLTTLGKIIGGGLPVGAYGGKKEIMAKIAPEGNVYQAGTLSGNPLAMQAGITTIKKLRLKDTYQRLKEKANFLLQEIAPILKKYQDKIIFQQLESIFFFSFLDASEMKTKNRTITSMDQVKKANQKLFLKFHNEMLERGIYLAPSSFEVGFLSLAHQKKDLKLTAKAIKESLNKILG